MSWIRKFDHIKARQFDEVIELWKLRSPVGIEVGQHALSNHIIDILDGTELPFDGQMQIGPIEARPLLSELYFGATKAFNVNYVAQDWATRGAWTNGSLHSYCSVLQIMQATMAIFGIFIVRVRSKYFVLDAFPWLGYKKADQTFKKTYGDRWWQHARIIADPKDLLDQGDIIDLYKRCLRVVAVPIWREAIVDELLRKDGSWFNRPRNNIVYNFTGWSDSDDLMGQSIHDVVAAIRSAAPSIFDLEAIVGFGSLPQSLLLGSLLDQIWRVLLDSVTIELNGISVPPFPVVGTNNLTAEFDDALLRAMSR